MIYDRRYRDIYIRIRLDITLDRSHDRRERGR